MNKRNSMGKERRRRKPCDKRDNNSVWKPCFENPSPSFKQIFFVEKQKQNKKKLSEDHDKTSK